MLLLTDQRLSHLYESDLRSLIKTMMLIRNGKKGLTNRAIFRMVYNHNFEREPTPEIYKYAINQLLSLRNYVDTNKKDKIIDGIFSVVESTDTARIDSGSV